MWHQGQHLLVDRRTIYDDPFIRNYIEDLLKNIRTQVLLRPACNLHKPAILLMHLRMHVPVPASECDAGVLTWHAQVVLKLIQPYTRIRIPYVSAQLNIPEHDVEQLLVSLILDARIAGHIDQARAVLQQSAHACSRAACCICCMCMPAVAVPAPSCSAARPG